MNKRQGKKSGSVKDSFTTREAAKLAGFETAMMLAYLCREGILKPSVLDAPGRGRARRFSFADVVLLRSLRVLLESGISVKKLKNSIRECQRIFGEDQSLRDIHRYLFADGKTCYLINSASGNSQDSLIDLSSDGQFAFGFVIDVHKMRDEIAQQIDKTNMKRAS